MQLVIRSASCWAVLWLAALLVPGAGAREAWTTSRVHGSPDPPPPYRVEIAFPQLKFKRPLDIAHMPDSGRLVVAELDGRVYSFPNDPTCAEADLAFDMVEHHPDLTALYGLAFHPDFERNRFVYICYVLANGQPDGSRVARFSVTRSDPPVIDPASERAIITWWSGGHNGGCLKFGPDGYLYISTGDGSGPTPPDRLRAGQDVGNLLSAILRIDVDRPEDGRPYRVPGDNPLVGIEGARAEIWAYGFRNPWRMSFDRATGDLWVGDVGWQLWEMIYRVEPGGNYGWPVTEGPQPALPEVPRGPTPILPPTVSHPHSEAASITGGFVYHGQRLPELRGAYVYGDYQTGKIWALRHDGKLVTWHKEIAQTPLQLVAFGEDPDGELLLLDYERTGQIYRLVPNQRDERDGTFPRRLSETGLFTSVADETPSAGVLPYVINAEQWADHTTSQRWMAVPGTEPVRVWDNDRLELPDGSVLAKTVSIELTRGVPASRRRLETQVLHRERGTWRPYTYIWNDEQSDAELAPAEGTSRTLKIRDADAAGGFREQSYRFASRAECQMCHNPWVELKTANFGEQSASPLAVSVPQWNRTVSLDGRSENQLLALARLGWLAGNIPADPDTAPRFVDPYDASADLNARARSYLHVNCAHCHQPHAGGAATIELTYDTPLARARVLDVRPTQGTFAIADARIIARGDPLGSVLLYRIAKLGSGRMPRLGAGLVDEEAVGLIHDWIAGLPHTRANGDGASSGSGHAAAVAGLHSDDASVRAGSIEELTSSTRGALALLFALDRDELQPAVREQVTSLASRHSLPEVRDLFERFVPPAERLARLGSVVDPQELLALPADPQRGRQVFFGQGQCQSCHRVEGMGETLGPDLSQIGKKYAAGELLAHVLDPSRLIEPQYVQYLIETTDGRVLTGLLAERNDREVVLRNAENKEIRIPAENVDLLAPQRQSLMPELLLRDLTPQQAADLLAYLRSLQ